MEEAFSYEGDECQYWPFSLDGKGYAQINMKGKIKRVHNLFCHRHQGPPPTPKHTDAAHSCGHRNCVTKRHMHWKTRKGNESDKVLHGTDQYGEKNHRAKLVEEDVAAIRLLNGAMPQRRIAELFSVSQTQVSRILLGKRW